MAEYGREQRNQLNKVVSHSESKKSQLKRFVDNSPQAVSQRKLIDSIQKKSNFSTLAYPHGTDIHVTQGQEGHLPHESWHVTQQKQSRIKPIIQREPWDRVRAAREAALKNRLNALPGSYGPEIGPRRVRVRGHAQTAAGERHFDQRMLDLIQTVFTGLPSSHIKGNASLARVVLRNSGGRQGMVSFYRPRDHSLNLVIPYDVSSLIYMQFDRWPFGDLASTYISENQHVAEQRRKFRSGDITKWDILKEVIGIIPRFLTHNVTSSGTTFGKLKQGLSSESFVQWIIRHETGHSVDDAIGWSANNHFQNPACGGWKKLEPVDMVTEILNTVGINDGVLDNLNYAYNRHTGVGYSSMLDAATNRRKQNLYPPHRGAALATFEVTNPGGTRIVTFAENVIEVGLSRPWENGGAINVGGRAYHRDTQHDTWVSYIHDKYALRNSNYQFQNPGEWFAESYQAYFKGQPANWGQNLNDPIARRWFTQNLVPPPIGGGGLINGLGDLVKFVGPAQPVVVPGVGTAVIPGKLENLFTAVSNVAVNIVKIPIDKAIGTASIPLKVLKYIPKVNEILRGFGL